jgi:hypothetical protein
MLTKERGEFEGKLAASQETIDELRREIATLKSQLAETSPAPIDLKKFFTPEQIEEYGESQCELLARTAMKAGNQSKADIQAAVDEALKPIREREQRQQQQRQEDAKSRFYAELAKLVPNYQAIDIDPLWLGWLNEEDPDSGIERNEILAKHARKGDAPRVAAMFNQFLKASGASPTPPKPSVMPEGGAAGARGNGDAPSGNEPALTKSFIKDFYKRKALGKISEADVKRIEARIEAAIESGQL